MLCLLCCIRFALFNGESCAGNALQQFNSILEHVAYFVPAPPLKLLLFLEKWEGKRVASALGLSLRAKGRGRECIEPPLWHAGEA